MATVTIAAVSARKTGATNGRRWTLFEVRAKNGVIYTTFDAEWQRHVGETLEASVSERNRLGAFPKAPARSAAHHKDPQAQTGTAASSPDRFAVLNDKLDRMMHDVAAILAHFA